MHAYHGTLLFTNIIIFLDNNFTWLAVGCINTWIIEPMYALSWLANEFKMSLCDDDT